MKSIRYALLIATVTLVLLTSRGFAGVNRWTTSGPFAVPISSVAIDPNDPETVYAGTGGEVIKSRDGGMSWRTCLEVPSGLAIFYSGLAIDPLFSSIVYAATNVGVFKSTDAGSSWSAITPPGSDPVAYSVAADPVTSSNILAGTAGGLFQSTDRGASWSGRLLASSVYSLAFSPQRPSTVFGADYAYSYYYATPSRLYKSTDAGTTWSTSGTGISIAPGALASDPTNPSILYAGSYDRGGVYKSVDSGSTWIRPNLELGSSAVSALVIDPRNPRTLYTANWNGVFRSLDGGVTWREFSTGLPGFPLIVNLAIDRTGTRLYAGTHPYQSTEFGGGVFSYQIFSGALDLSVGADQQSRLLFTDLDHRAALRSFDNSGISISSGSHGPYTDWAPAALADGSDGLTRVLWNNLDGSAALWLLGPTGPLASYVYRPEARWTAVDVSVGIDGTTEILWTNLDGRTEIARVAVSGAEVSREKYGPFSGWLARSISSGADGLTRVLWTNTDGRVGLSLIDGGHIVATYRFTPAPGWTARDVAVASDNQARILFGTADGRMVLWSVDNAGAVTDSESVYGPPLSGQTATRIAAGPDASTRVLWTSPHATGTLWRMDLDNVRQRATAFCGALGEDSGCGDWDY